jgi:uroporphyrinogen-III synthase
VASEPLAGCGVAVTRPVHQAEPLCRELEAAGATVIRFPTLAIAALAPGMPVGPFDWILYTSANAVECSAALRRLPGRIAAIGPATAAALGAAGARAELVADGTGSEALLDALDPRLGPGQRVLIVTGRDARALLPQALVERGHAVEVAEVYARTRPASDPRPLLDAHQRGALHAITITSDAALTNLHALLGRAGGALLSEVQLVVASARAVRLAQELGIVRAPLVANDAGADALVAALAAWWPNAAAQTDGTRTRHGR